MARILLQFAHPILSKSRIHATLLQACLNLKNVTINDLYEQYPDLYINVEREQRLLLSHDIIIFQHPFYWYSSPAIIKQWFDLVLEHNWAYGSRGNALAGKSMMNAISCGGSRQAYTPTGTNRFTINQFLAPFDQTAHLCKMTYLPPFVIHATHRLTADELTEYGNQYCSVLSALANDRFTPDNFEGIQYINELVTR
ncbi:NAD(P)H-dependent oxidoreductase [Fibrella forsythiae]|uniref:NAD(P)H-dependent oxidoreductase n=1 Tax=Fibrella forsythiae TaxID=2817061 RepID=A0ABS3JJA9_9BACT|nr:NAD(P)H-dependent oxidoreductase [Fibrella forsythiae]MBO0950094.1 NAD(P)H-dependent oxidoreductase [Fibrella forsythiae]